MKSTKWQQFCLGLHVLNQQDCCNKPNSVLPPRALDSWGITTVDTGPWFTEDKWCGQAFQPMAALLSNESSAAIGYKAWQWHDIALVRHDQIK